MQYDDIDATTVRDAVVEIAEIDAEFDSYAFLGVDAIKQMHPHMDTPDHKGGLPVLARWLVGKQDLTGAELVERGWPAATWKRTF
jgi:hypothetical protein